MSFNYLDGIPVKISEQFKPPPKVTIPHAIINRINVKNYIDSPQFEYDFTLETSVRSKMDQWRRVRQTEKENRKERIRKYELDRARSLEIKQKQLLTAVSYPNAEELSSDEEKENCINSKQFIPENNDEKQCEQQLQKNNDRLCNEILKPSELWSDTILMPTVVPTDFQSCYTPVIQNYSPSTMCSISNINYSDFENIESSPFDNIELKTINELDVLAQVLNVTQIHSNEKTSLNEDGNFNNELQMSSSVLNNQNSVTEKITLDMEKISTDTYSEHFSQGIDTVEQYSSEPILSNKNDNNADSTITNCTTSNHLSSQNSQIQSLHQLQQHIPEQISQNYENMNGVGVTTTAAGFYYNCNIPTSNQTYYNYNYNYQLNSTPTSQHLAPTPQIIASHMGPSYNQYNYTSNLLNNQSYIISSNGSQLPNNISININEINDYRNKSKSVPDICKELTKEIRDSEARRARNNSHTLEDHNGKIIENQIAANIQLKNNEVNSLKSFLKLSPSSQTLVENISSMGFPLERVSKIAEIFGNDDKKIIEHLIPLSELLDLGFDETKTSEALIKFDNNKEKALDFLIS